MLPETTANRTDEENPKRGGGRGWQIHGQYRRLRADEVLVTAWRIKP